MAPENNQKASHNPLADEAAEWFARMRGPDADASRDAFERWLQRGALHRAAYNRASEIFAIGKALREEASTPPRLPKLRKLVPAALLLIGAFGALLLYATTRMPVRPQAAELAARAAPSGQVSTALGEIRAFRLADGSVLTLDTDSLVTFDMKGKDRNLRLQRGRARFSVTHDGRPFRVYAGNGWVTAHGTVFDVALTTAELVQVRLIQGGIDVALSSPGAGQRSPSKRLAPGDAVAFTRAFLAQQPTDMDMAPTWPSATIEAKAMRLGSVLAIANRYGPVRLVAANAQVADLRVTGRFAIADTQRLAERLATLFDLIIEKHDPDVWTLTSNRGEK